MNKKRPFKKDFKKEYKPDARREKPREQSREYSRDVQRQPQRDTQYERKGTEIICGKNAVMELLRAKKRKCHEVWVLEGEREQHVSKILQHAQDARIPVHAVKKDELTKITRVEKHQGIAARADEFRYVDADELLHNLKDRRTPGLFLVLDGIQDPQNLGSLLRTSHQLGVDAVLIPKDNAALVGPAASRASAGATEYLPISVITNIVSTLENFKEQGAWIYGAESSPSAKGLYQVDFTKEHAVIVMGGEGKGMRRLVREACDFFIEIPMSGRLDSLNVGVAGAVILAEVQRQRRAHQNLEKIPQKP